jgi:hypothetical protein
VPFLDDTTMSPFGWKEVPQVLTSQ